MAVIDRMLFGCCFSSGMFLFAINSAEGYQSVESQVSSPLTECQEAFAAFDEAQTIHEVYLEIRARNVPEARDTYTPTAEHIAAMSARVDQLRRFVEIPFTEYVRENAYDADAQRVEIIRSNVIDSGHVRYSNREYRSDMNIDFDVDDHLQLRAPAIVTQLGTYTGSNALGASTRVRRERHLVPTILGDYHGELGLRSVFVNDPSYDETILNSPLAPPQARELVPSLRLVVLGELEYPFRVWTDAVNSPSFSYPVEEQYQFRSIVMDMSCIALVGGENTVLDVLPLRTLD